MNEEVTRTTSDTGHAGAHILPLCGKKRPTFHKLCRANLRHTPFDDLLKNAAGTESAASWNRCDLTNNSYENPFFTSIHRAATPSFHSTCRSKI